MQRQGGGFGDFGAYYGDTEQIGLKLHEQFIDAHAAVDFQGD